MQTYHLSCRGSVVDFKARDNKSAAIKAADFVEQMYLRHPPSYYKEPCGTLWKTRRVHVPFRYSTPRRKR